MSLRLRQMEPGPGDPKSGAASPGSGGAEQTAPSASGGSPMPPPPADDIDRWLATFSTLARMPEARRAAVTDELEDHLRCRTRDLMLRGASEPEAIRKSIAELGEAAELAARFRLAARTPIWRHVMTFSILGISAAALTLSVIAIAGGPQQQGGGPTGVVFRSAADDSATSASLADVRLQLDLEDALVADFFTRAGEAAKTRVFVHWDDLPVDREEKITLQVGEVSFPTALRLLNTRLDAGDDGIDFRQRDGVLEFASRNYFDQEEAQLVRYDLAPILGHTKSHPTADGVADLIYAFVDSHSWDVNGGTAASLRIAGKQMFINAPARMLPKVEWILAQFARGAEDANAAAAEGEAISVRVIPLREADASALGAALNQIVAGLRGVKVTTDARTNALLISATADWHDRIDALLPLLDRPAPARDDHAAAAAPPSSVEKLRAIHALMHATAARLGRFPFALDDVAGANVNSDGFIAPGGDRFWLDIPAMETMDPQRIVGYDPGALARAEYVPTLFADGAAELLAPGRLRELARTTPHDGLIFDLPEQTLPGAPAKTHRAYIDASLDRLRNVPVLANLAAHKLGRAPQSADEVLGLVATVNQFSAPDGQRYWLDVAALHTFDSHRIAGYDRGALARGEYVATLFADGRAEALAPPRFRQLTEQGPNADIDFDLPEQIGAAPDAPATPAAPTTPVRISADPDGQVACRWTGADSREHTLRASTISLQTADLAFEGSATFSPGS